MVAIMDRRGDALQRRHLLATERLSRQIGINMFTSGSTFSPIPTDP